MRLKKYFRNLLLALMVFFSAFSFLSKPVLALVGNSGYTLQEVWTDLGEWKNGPIGNNRNLLGRMTTNYRDSVLRSSSGEFVFCIEPGVNTGSSYGVSSISALFDKIQSESGYRTSSWEKQRWVARLLQRMNDSTRYDNGTADRRCMYTAIQTLIWEVICEERNNAFEYIGAKSGKVAVRDLILFSSDYYRNTFYTYYHQISYLMQKYSTIPSPTGRNTYNVPTIVLDKYDENMGGYYAIIKDDNGMADFYYYNNVPSGLYVSTTKNSNGEHEIRISTRSHDAEGTVSGYNDYLRGSDSITSVLAAHGSGSSQAMVSALDIKDPVRNSYFYVDVANSTLSINPNGGCWDGNWHVVNATQDFMTTKSIPDPWRDGYSFTGWSRSGGQGFDNGTFTYGTQDASLTATWQINSYNLTVKPNGGSWNGGTWDQSFSQEYGSTKWIGEPTREGYTFTGWSLSGGGSYSDGTYTFGSSDATLTANWQINSYTLTVNPNGGVWNDATWSQSFVQTYGSTKWIGDPWREGYTFTGWSLSGGGSYSNGTYTYGTSDATLTANWQINSYTLTVNPNGGNWGGGDWVQTFTQNYGTTKWIGDPWREGYTFTGWELSGRGSYNDGTFTYGAGDATLTATWRINYYNLTVNPNGDNRNLAFWEGSPIIQVFRQAYQSTKTISRPSRVGYTFERWNLSGYGSWDGWTYTYGAGDGTLTAEWSNAYPVITTPVITNPNPPGIVSNIPPFIEGDTVIIQLGDRFNPLDYATAWDKEDGVITDKIEVVNNPVPNTNGFTTRPGRYEVSIKVTDLGGLTTTGIIKVLVNDPPRITAEDRYFFIGDDVNLTEILRKTTASDYEDGDIKGNIRVTQITDAINHTNVSPNRVPTGDVGQYIVRYKVTDRYRASAETTARFFVVNSYNDVYSYGLRYISKDFIDTLGVSSKWRTNGNLYNELVSSLNKSGDGEALYVLEFNDSEVNEIKEFLGGSSWSKELNRDLLSRYLGRVRTR